MADATPEGRAWWAGWLPPAFVILSLLGLLVVPLAMEWRVREIRAEIDSGAAPARDLVDAIQLTLARQVSATRGYLLTGEPHYLTRYRMAAAEEYEARLSLARIAGSLGPEVARRLDVYTAAVGAWQAANEPFLEPGADAAFLSDQLPYNQSLYEAALSAAAHVGDAIGAATRERLAELRAAERLALASSVGLALLALLSAGIVLVIGRHVRALADQNLAQARRQEQLRRQAEAALKAREEVLAVVSHDLRNPLNSIVMAAETVGADATPPALRIRYAAIIQRAAGRMTRLIEDLLDVSRMEGGQALAVEAGPLPVGAVLEECLEAFAAAAEEKSIDLVVDRTAPGIVVLADRQRLFQVLSNLVGNAVKFTPEGGRVTLGVVARDDFAEFSVADTGPGIHQRDLPHVFEPFWQEGRTAHLGTGLGLAIARGIVTAHGGVIGVESRPGHGTTFRFTIPLTRTAAATAPPAPPGRPPAVSQTRAPAGSTGERTAAAD